MQTNYRKYIQSLCFVALLGVFAIGTFLTSCSDDSNKITDATLFSYGPVPVARGGELRFIGANLDKVTSIVLPGNITIAQSEFTEQTGTSIKLTVPQNAVEGYVQLISGSLTIDTKTKLGFSEPISIGSFAPLSIKPGATLTIEGDYLNLVGAIIFTDRVSVDSTQFLTKSRKKITLKVPVQAQTGKIAVSNAAVDPIIVYSEGSLTVTVPTITNVAPNPVKPGTTLTLTGTNFDLVTSVSMGGNIKITEFTQTGGTSLTFKVPMNTQDGTLMLNLASGVSVSSAVSIVMVAPTVNIATKTVKNGGTLLVTGTNLDLVNDVVFSGGTSGTIQAGGTATNMVVNIPDAATSGEVMFKTTSAKSVSGGTLTLVKPAIASFSPASSKPNTSVVILGTNLDLVANVYFAGNVKAAITTQSATSITATIPVGCVTGVIKLVAVNGSEVLSAGSITILQNLPNFISFGEAKGAPGKILTINGTNLDLVKELVFPGNVTATSYGKKTDTKIEVYVPKTTATGFGQIKMITYEGEEGLFPQIFIGSTDPITGASLMMSDFNGQGASQSTWGGSVSFGTPAVDLDGTAAMLGKVASGWQWAWSQNWDTRPSIANPGNYVIKFDVCITKAAPGVTVGMTLKGWATSVDLGAPFEKTTGGQWITMSFDVLNSGMSIDGTGDWGMFINGGDYDLTGIMIDNLRFDPK